jgi:hypothetical protein
MIAFSRVMMEEHERPAPILIFGPCIVTPQLEEQSVLCNATPSNDDLFAVHVARQQTELAMLQRALVSCGLMGHETNGTLPTGRTHATDRTKE